MATATATREQMFLADDGVVLCMTLLALDELGVLDPSLAARAPVARLLPGIEPVGFGYLRAGLRSLAGQGWLEEPPTLDPATTFLDWTAAGRDALRHRERYLAVGRFLRSFADAAPGAWSKPWSDAQVDELDLLRAASGEHVAHLGEHVAHLDGALAVPEALSALADADDERIPARDALHFGIVGSYLPLLARLAELYRGELVVTAPDPGAAEWHVDRELNVRASAAAHRRYFADANAIFLELFDRRPLEEQPRFVADMGCGDASWLIHLDGLIRDRTLRGRNLDRHPLALVGIDLNAAALDPARRRLEASGVDALLLPGDVGDPDGLAAALAAHGLDSADGLHIRSFLDHDRVYRGAGDDVAGIAGLSSGAYVDAAGRPLEAGAVERDLVAHLRRWTPHVRRHGMVVLEAHCVAPRIARRHLGALHSVAFDAYHAYSHQYPVEYPAFVECCRAAGLERVARQERQYPASRPFVAVSLNRLVPAATALRLPGQAGPAGRAGKAGAGARPDGWRPPDGVDLEDGEGLHRLLFEQGDLARPRAWSLPATGWVAGRALDAVERRLDRCSAGDRIVVLDYGAGTGLAAIELLKGCVDRGIDRRLSDRGATLELHLVDLPSSWFAQGHALLADCAWTRFHSLRADDGGFRRLDDVLGGREVDVAIASMVFHLLPQSAMERVAAELAGVLAPDGRLVWSSPDLAPAGANAVLFHDANRELRARWLAANRDSLEPSVLVAGQERADRRILRRPRAAEDVVDALERELAGIVERPAYEMTAEEIVDAILVPSNQGEYLSEIADRERRER
ncbi:MAG TPA: class I SAM-dependent methyltransferase, partial [Gaiella sp.]|nr:class I SAM-dependent methyltransferase [Gaiella sp.]